MKINHLIMSTLIVVGVLAMPGYCVKIGTATGSVKIILHSGGKLPFGVPEGLQVSLSATDGTYTASASSSGAVQSALSRGKFSFFKVPQGTTLQFNISYNDAITGRNLSASASFTMPARSTMNIGTFTINLEKGEITSVLGKGVY